MKKRLTQITLIALSLMMLLAPIGAPVAAILGCEDSSCCCSIMDAVSSHYTHELKSVHSCCCAGKSTAPCCELKQEVTKEPLGMPQRLDPNGERWDSFVSSLTGDKTAPTDPGPQTWPEEISRYPSGLPPIYFVTMSFLC